jgi:hypothetical protein
MKRQILVTFSAAALIFFCSPLTRAQSENSQATGRHSNNMNGNWSSQQVQENGGSNNSADAQKLASEMVPAHASLEKTVDAKNAHSGDPVRAKLGENVQLKNGPNLPSGTILIGKVTTDKTQPNNTTLGLRFTEAKLTDGTTVPIKAMIVGIERVTNMAGMSDNAVPARDLWNSHVYRVDQEKAVGGADLHSNITASNSAVITSTKKSDVKIDSGSRLDMAIAKQPAWQSKGGQSNPTM